jgi:hypothetical protein
LRTDIFWDMTSRAMIARYVFEETCFFHFIITHRCSKQVPLNVGNECTSPHTITLDAPTFVYTCKISSWFAEAFLEETIYGGSSDHRSRILIHRQIKNYSTLFSTVN